MKLKSHINIKGARVNNLKNIDVKIPHNKLIVITGLSGSGKSSLAFDTLYSEGRRRYIESLSIYIRHFFEKIKKPKVDFIQGLPPTITIDKKINNYNLRSTVATYTEIYYYLQILFARIGKIYSPLTGKLLHRSNTNDVINEIFKHPIGTFFFYLQKSHHQILNL